MISETTSFWFGEKGVREKESTCTLTCMFKRDDTTRLSIKWNEYMQALAFQSQAAQAL